MHLQNPFEKTASVAGMRRKLPRNFCKAKPNKRPVALPADAVVLDARSDSMKPTLLLNDEPEIVRLLLEEVTSHGMAVRENEARAGCNCDRWGHPCAGCLDRKKPKEAGAPISSPVNSEGK
jgi:hypothetical protein